MYVLLTLILATLAVWVIVYNILIFLIRKHEKDTPVIDEAPDFVIKVAEKIEETEVLKAPRKELEREEDTELLGEQLDLLKEDLEQLAEEPKASAEKQQVLIEETKASAEGSDRRIQSVRNKTEKEIGID